MDATHASASYLWILCIGWCAIYGCYVLDGVLFMDATHASYLWVLCIGWCGANFCVRIVYYVTSSYILCHIIIHTMSHHHTYYVTLWSEFLCADCSDEFVLLQYLLHTHTIFTTRTYYSEFLCADCSDEFVLLRYLLHTHTIFTARTYYSEFLCADCSDEFVFVLAVSVLYQGGAGQTFLPTKYFLFCDMTICFL